jgi:hypothetical protein
VTPPKFQTRTVIIDPVPRFLAVVAALLLCLNSASAQQNQINKPPEITGEGGSIPVSIIDGRMVIACDISGPRMRAPINLWLDFDGAYGFQLHNRAAAGLPAETQAGRPIPLTLHFPNFDMTLARRELGPEEDFEKFTKYNSKAIGENALSGAIGVQVLKHFDVVFDLPSGQVSLLKPGQLNGRQAAQHPKEILARVTTQNDLVWLPVTLEGGDKPIKRALAIGSSRYDTVFDKRLCNSLGAPAGNIGAVKLDKIDLAPYVAFRPDDVVLVHPDGVAGVMGLNLLKNFRVHVDRKSLLVTVQVARSPVFPKEELAWFQAMIAEDSAKVVEWLTANPKSRLNAEAAEFLLTLCLDEGAEEEQLEQAVKFVNDSMLEDLRATRMFDLLEELVNEGQEALGVKAGQLGLKSARKDRYPESNYKLHGRLGEILLATDNRQAWRHLLSAAFGLPEDGMINYNLGRCYEANGKPTRAFSRYVQALIKEDSSALAMAALNRMDKELPPEEKLTIEKIDRMISGRVHNFSAPDSYEPKEDTGKTGLVEFFTNAYVGNERGGAIGGALGNQGLMSHFDKQHCVFLSYHLPTPRIEPLCNPLAAHMARWLSVPNPATHVISGRDKAPGAARRRQGEALYKMLKSAVIKRLAGESSILINGEVSVENGRVTGGVDIDAFDPPIGQIVVQVVIAERGVVFHGSSTVVIHRMLARGLATEGDLSGVAFEPDGAGRFTIEFDRSLEQLQAENEKYLDKLEQGTAAGVRLGTRIEPNSVEVIVVMRDKTTGRVYQAYQCPIKGRKEAAE